MKEVGTYRPQFDDTVRTYAEMKYQKELAMKEFYENGCQMTEEYINKSGIANIRKTALYMSIETLRKDMVNYESILGLTPSGLKKINKEMDNGKKKSSALAKALSGIET